MIWPPPPLHPSLERKQIHVWQTKLDQPDDRLPTYLRFLSENELAQADRFHFAEHRRDFIVGRAFLRTALGRYLGVDGARVIFDYTTYGKPSIAGPKSQYGLFFNLTHSHHLALLAVTLEGDVGIDVEYVHNVDDGIPERYFSPSEVSALRALPKNLQQEAFFNCWTRKEAYIKSLGEGLSLALDSFDVSLEPGAPAAILGIRHRAEQPSAWTLMHLTPTEGYVGALAIRARDCSLRFWKLDPP
jgi:4'-phosphopantetheinyl transferase